MKNLLVSAIREFSNGQAFEDDVTFVIVKVV